MLVKKNSLIKIKFPQGFKCSYFLSINLYFCQLKRSIPIIGIYKTSKSIFNGTYCEDIFKRFLGKQKQDGSFGTLQETTFIVKALSGKSILDIKNNVCPMTQGK